jgi:hypothetical protein
MVSVKNKKMRYIAEYKFPYNRWENIYIWNNRKFKTKKEALAAIKRDKKKIDPAVKVKYRIKKQQTIEEIIII